MNTPFLFLSLLSLASLIITVSANFYNDFDITWGNDHAQILDNGNQLQLTLDHTSGTCIYLFGKFVFPWCTFILFCRHLIPSFPWWQVVGVNPRKSICSPRLICKSSWYLETLQAQSPPTMYVLLINSTLSYWITFIHSEDKLYLLLWYVNMLLLLWYPAVIVSRPQTWRNRLWISGKPHRRSLYHAH